MSEKITDSGLKYEDITEGDGDTAAPGQLVTVHYTGWLTDGNKFDSSKDRNDPFRFKLGAGQVIRGWDEGVAGMKIGGTRKLTIPANLGYGAQGAGGVIPPNATLVFEVELLGIRLKFDSVFGFRFQEILGVGLPSEKRFNTET